MRIEFVAIGNELLNGDLVDTVVPTAGLREAELAKLLENTYRHVNIALMNEMAVFCHELGIDLWAAIEAAKTKPFGFEAFYPGPGVGGHCIPIDPFYLSWKARQNGFESRFIELAGHINGRMPHYVLERVSDALNTVGKPLKGSAIHLFGVAYKANVGDVRESPAIDLDRVYDDLLLQWDDLAHNTAVLKRAGCLLRLIDAVGDRHLAGVCRVPSRRPSGRLSSLEPNGRQRDCQIRVRAYGPSILPRKRHFAGRRNGSGRNISGVFGIVKRLQWQVLRGIFAPRCRQPVWIFYRNSLL
jgi:hypothetical protein